VIPRKEELPSCKCSLTRTTVLSFFPMGVSSLYIALKGQEDFAPSARYTDWTLPLIGKLRKVVRYASPYLQKNAKRFTIIVLFI
jgi:hypothetical protein